MAEALEGVGRLKRKLVQLREQKTATMKREIKSSLLNIQNGARLRVKVDRGRLRNSVTHETDSGGLRGRAGTNAKYGPPVEFGRGPGKRPPLKEIEGWVRRKGLAKGAKKGQKRRMERGIAFLIARHIGRHGIKAAPFLFPAFEEERPKFLARLRRELRKSAADVATRTR